MPLPPGQVASTCTWAAGSVRGSRTPSNSSTGASMASARRQLPRRVRRRSTPSRRRSVCRLGARPPPRISPTPRRRRSAAPISSTTSRSTGSTRSGSGPSFSRRIRPLRAAGSISCGWLGFGFSSSRTCSRRRAFPAAARQARSTSAWPPTTISTGRRWGRSSTGGSSPRFASPRCRSS